MAAIPLEQSPLVILGIGPRGEELLLQHGIRTLAQMLARRPAAVKELLGFASLRQVKEWFGAARLLQLEDIDPHMGEALAESGIDSLAELSDAGLQTLERATRGLEHAPSVYRLAQLQREAGKLRGTGVVTGRVLDGETGAALPDVLVDAGRREARTDAHGEFVLAGIAAGSVRLVVDVGFGPPLSTRATVVAGVVPRPITFRPQPRPDANRTLATWSERDGQWAWQDRGVAARVRVRPLSAIPDGTFLKVRGVNANGSVRLLHLYRTRVGREVIAELTDVPKSALPAGTRIADVLRYEGGAFTRSQQSARDVALQKFQDILGPRALSDARRVLQPGSREGGAARND